MPGVLEATGEEEMKLKVARIPRSPTAQEWDDRMSHGAEFRDWRLWCFQGNGKSRHHVQDPEKVWKLGLTVSLNLTRANSADDFSDESGPPTLVVHDSKTLAIWATFRESKEIAEDLVEWVCCNLRDAGYIGFSFTLKSDGEEGMKALKGRVALNKQCKTSSMQSPVQEPTSNGAMDASIRSWKGAI